jgi:hypothetical protein
LEGGFGNTSGPPYLEARISFPRPVGHDWFAIVRHLGEGIETDGPFGIGRVDVDEIVGACFRNLGERQFGKVAVRIEKREAFAGHEVLADEIEKQGAFAGAGLADDIECRRRSSGSSMTGSPVIRAPMQSC